MTAVSLLPRNMVYNFTKDKAWRNTYRRLWSQVIRPFARCTKFKVTPGTKHIAILYTRSAKLMEIRTGSDLDESYFLYAVAVATLLIERYIEEDQIIITYFDYKLPINKIKFADKMEAVIAKIAYELIMPEIEFRKIYFESAKPYMALEEKFKVPRELVISRIESLYIKSSMNKSLRDQIKCLTLESTTYEEFVEYILYKLGITTNTRNNPKILKELFLVYEEKFGLDN